MQTGDWQPMAGNALAGGILLHMLARHTTLPYDGGDMHSTNDVHHPPAHISCKAPAMAFSKSTSTTLWASSWWQLGRALQLCMFKTRWSIFCTTGRVTDAGLHWKLVHRQVMAVYVGCQWASVEEHIHNTPSKQLVAAGEGPAAYL